MKRLILVGVSLILSFASMGVETLAAKPRVERPLKVLMIGNSFSICVLKEMPKVAQDLGLKLDLCSMYIGGCSLARHADNLTKPETSPYGIKWSYQSNPSNEPPFRAVLKNGNQGNIPQLLAGDRWDVVTVQQASHLSWQPNTYEPYGSRLIETIRKLAPQAKIMVQETWSYSPWDGRLAKWGFDREEMFLRLEHAYADFAASHGLERIRTGKAIDEYRKRLPVTNSEHFSDDLCGSCKFGQKNGKWFATGDQFHLNARGEFFQALVWTARLFDVDVTKSTYLPKCLAERPECAVLMRKIATELKR